MAKKTYRVKAEDTVVFGHTTGETFELAEDQTDYDVKALISAGTISEVKPKQKEEK